MAPKRKMQPEQIYAMACLVINKVGKILLLKRSPDKKFFPNEWAAVGAAPLSKGENMEMIATREVRDELGLEGKILKTGNEMVFMADGREWHIFPFLGQVDSDDITLNNEHTEYRWITKDDLEDYKLIPFMEEAITKLLK